MVSATGIATQLALSVAILIAPAFLFFLIDMAIGSDLYELYRPILGISIHLVGIVFIPLAEIIDYVLNLLFFDILSGLLKKFGIKITLKLNLSKWIPLTIEQITAAVALLGINSKVNSSSDTPTDTATDTTGDPQLDHALRA